ncbi:uncharacterized protein LOC124132099 [Haliotis rufescens]|uniref:uncharacterized protein LOC124132099 n=1 Tax=Haliotis rufescens TaxID=6454 RepID=UPI00201F007F|nr:uncharacterized protein LOC124132099 [Haliotis rufescens]
MNRLSFLWRLIVTTGILKETIGKAFIETKDVQLTTNIDLSQRDQLLLQVRGCKDLFVALREKEGGNEALIRIGVSGNIGLFVIPCHHCAVQNGATSAYLDCAAFKPFWVKWAGLTVQIGHGHDVGLQEIVLTTSIETYKVNFLDLTGVADWIIETEASKNVRHQFRRTLKGMIDALKVFKELNAPNIINCIEACHEIEGCQSINYNKQDSVCELFAALPGEGDFKAKANVQSWIVAV